MGRSCSLCPPAEVSREGSSRQCQEPAWLPAGSASLGKGQQGGGQGSSRDWHTSPRGLQWELGGGNEMGAELLLRVLAVALLGIPSCL